MNTVYKIEVHQEAVVGPCKAIAPQSPLKFLERSPHLVLFFAGMDYRFIAKDLNVRNVSDPYENWPAFPGHRDAFWGALSHCGRYCPHKVRVFDRLFQIPKGNLIAPDYVGPTLCNEKITGISGNLLSSSAAW